MCSVICGFVHRDNPVLVGFAALPPSVGPTNTHAMGLLKAMGPVGCCTRRRRTHAGCPAGYCTVHMLKGWGGKNVTMEHIFCITLYWSTVYI